MDTAIFMAVLTDMCVTVYSGHNVATPMTFLVIPLIIMANIFTTVFSYMNRQIELPVHVKWYLFCHTAIFVACQILALLIFLHPPGVYTRLNIQLTILIVIVLARQCSPAANNVIIFSDESVSV